MSARTNLEGKVNSTGTALGWTDVGRGGGLLRGHRYDYRYVIWNESPIINVILYYRHGRGLG